MLLGAATLQGAIAGEIPWTDSAYYHFAQDQSLETLIRDFTAIQGIDVVISSSLGGTVNGIFENIPPSEFWDNLTKVYNLAWFFDGSALYVYPNTLISTKVIPMSSQESAALKEILVEMDLAGSNNSVRYMPSTRMMVVSGPPRFMEVVQAFLEKIQVNTIQNFTDETVVQIFPLKYAFAYDVSLDVGTDGNGSVQVEGVATLLQRIISGINTIPPPIQGSVSIGRSQANGQSVEGVLQKKVAEAAEKNAQRIASASSAERVPSEKSAAKEKSGSVSLEKVKESLPPSLGAQMGKGPAAAAESPRTSHITSITHDARLNAVIIRDRLELMPFYQALIDRFDVPTKAVEIRVAIVDVNVGNSRQMGLNVVQFLNGNRELSWRPLGGDADASSGEDSSFFAKLSNLIGYDTIGARLQALEDANVTKTFSRPSVLTLDNLAAVISQSDQAYVSVAGTEAVDLFSVSATVSLRVIPHIVELEDGDGNLDRQIKLFVNINDGLLDVSGSHPKVSTSQISTQTVLREGQSLVVGGYYKERHGKQKKGIPILTQLPFIGRAFSISSKNMDTVERLFIISPRIIELTAEEGDPYAQFFKKTSLDGKPFFGLKNFRLGEKRHRAPIRRTLAGH
jgi:type III secretion protein C